MRYRWFILFLFLLLPLPVAGQNQIRVHWEQYDTIVDIQPDGSLRVREQQVLVVAQGPLRRMTRTFTTGDQGRVRNIQVFENGQPYRRDVRNAPGTYVGSDTGQAAEIQLWFLDPSANRHEFTIEYTVDAVLIARNDQATLDWAFFWRGANAPEIRDGSVEIRFPQQVNVSELRLDASGAPVRLVSESNPVRWELTDPVQGAELNVQVTFPRAILAANASFRSAEGQAVPRSNPPSDQVGNPNNVPVPGAAPARGFDIGFCLVVLLFLFIAFTVIRSSARRRGSRGYRPVYGPRPGYGQDPFGHSTPRHRRRRRYGGWGGWGGGLFPPIIITPPSPPRDQGGPFNAPYDGSPSGDSGGSSSSWGDSGGSSSSWGDSGGSSSSWGDSGGGGSSWGGGGGDSDRGGSGGGSFG